MKEPERLIGTSPAIRAVASQVDDAARSDATILITGESGVGKEVVARLIHLGSARRHAALVTINCASLPDSLLESELFGHVRGAFTGAYRDKTGLLQMGDGGTVFMDEVGEMSLRMQAVLLRFLETGEVHRVGADRSNGRVNVRVIAATNRKLGERIASGEFREDLYYRLNVIRLSMPAVRERREDIPALLGHFLQHYSAEQRTPPPTLAPETLARLVDYPWPGNVRELKNVVQRLTLRWRAGGTVTAADLPPEIGPAPVVRTAPEQPPATLAERLLERMTGERASFWTVIYEPFMARDLTRDTVRATVRLGLERTRGSYRLLVELFNLPASDYKRLLNFLRKYDCQVPFQQFRSLGGSPGAEPAPADVRKPFGAQE